jgi:hypothetical protein
VDRIDDVAQRDAAVGCRGGLDAHVLEAAETVEVVIVSRTSAIFSGAPCFDWIASSSADSGAGRPSMITATDETGRRRRTWPRALAPLPEGAVRAG